MSRHWLQCIDCEERLHFPNVFCTYKTGPRYVLPNGPTIDWIPILRQEIWCGSCNSPSYAERVPSTREFEVALGLRRVAASGGVFDIRDSLLDLTDADFSVLLEGLRQRSSPGICVICGGRAYVPLESSNGRIRNLQHESCGGLFVEYWEINSNHGERIWLDFSGKLISPPTTDQTDA